MNIYVIIFAVAAFIVIAWNIRNSFHKGFAHEISSLIAMAAAVFVMVLLSGMVSGLRDGSIPRVVSGFLLLGLFLLFYWIFHLILKAINLLVKLPLIRGLDQGLGVVIGFFKGAAVLYILEYLMRNYLLV